MKFFIFILILVSNSVVALECRYSNGDAEIREKNIESATGIYFGRIVKAEYVDSTESKDTVPFQFKIFDAIKGNLNGVINLISYPKNGSLGTEVGQTYIVVLGKTDEVNFCNMVFPIGPGFSNLARLQAWALRVDIPYAPRVKKLLEQYGKLP